MTETWKYLHGQYHVNQMPLPVEKYKHHRKRTLYEAEEGEVSQAPAKKLLQTSRGEPLEHADTDRKYCDFIIRKYLKKKPLRCLLACSQIRTKR